MKQSSQIIKPGSGPGRPGHNVVTQVESHGHTTQRTLVVANLPIIALIPDPKNARQHPQRHVTQLARSIEQFGFTCPLLIDAQRHVIAGHGRLLAVQQLGWTEVPTITLEGLTPEQARAYRIADNRLTDCSVWNERLLAEELQSLSALDLDFELSVIGFEPAEIDLRIQGLELDGDDEESQTDKEDLPVVSVVGDLWRLERHRILCANALESSAYETLLGNDRAAMVFIDPPYNVKIAGHVSGNGQIHHREFPMASGEMSRAEFTAFLDTSLGLIKRSSVPGALIFVCIDWRHLYELLTASEAQALELKNLVVWNKGIGGMGSLYRSQHELIFVLKAGDAKHINNVQLGKFGRNRTNVWAYPGANSFARDTDEGNPLTWHPSVKPVALVADAILDASLRGDCVLDSYLGSGTTIIAAEKTGRIGLGIELDPRYVDVAIRRWQRLTGQAAVHAGTGVSFDQVAQLRASATSSAQLIVATRAQP